MANDLFEVLNPIAIQPPIQLTPLSPRLSELDNKKIYFVDLGKPESDAAFDALEKYLLEFAPHTKFIRRKKKLTYFSNEPDLWTEIEREADGLIFGIFD